MSSELSSKHNGIKQDSVAQKRRSAWWFRFCFFSLFALASLLFAWTFQFFFNDAFFMAVECGEETNVPRMLSFNPWLLYARDRQNFGATPLILAIKAHQAKTALLLIRKGANVNAKDGWEQTPLYYSIFTEHKHKDVFDFLVAHGANLNAQERDGCTLLYSAAAVGAKDIVEILLAAKADPSVQDLWGRTAAQRATEEGQREIAKILIKAEKDAKANASKHTTKPAE